MLLAKIKFILYKDKTIATCKNCKNEIEAKRRQCPYCGILNPTVTLKDVFVSMAIVLIVMGVVTFFININK